MPDILRPDGTLAHSNQSNWWDDFTRGLGGFWNRVSGTTEQQDNANREAAADRSFQAQMMREAEVYNSAEAAKNRDWQTLMSNTAHQRAVEDMEAAGINPMMAAGNQAMTPSGATASVGSPSGARAAAIQPGNGGLAGLIAKVAGMAMAGAIGAKVRTSATKAASRGGSIRGAVNKALANEGVRLSARQHEVTDAELAEALKDLI